MDLKRFVIMGLRADNTLDQLSTNASYIAIRSLLDAWKRYPHMTPDRKDYLYTHYRVYSDFGQTLMEIVEHESHLLGQAS